VRSSSLALASVILSSSATVLAAADTSNFQGLTVQAGFFSTDGCISTDVTISATESKGPHPPDSPTTVSIADIGISQFDQCTGTTVLDAFGEVTLTDQSFQVGPQLISATLKPTGQVTDSVTGSIFNIDVDLTWTPTGPLTAESDRIHVHSPGLIFQSHSNGTSRDAQASGSLSLGGVNLTPQPSGFAVIASVKRGSVTISRS
jgi:hypothetical protein